MNDVIRKNAEEDPAYTPYCMRCPGLVRMVKMARFHWRCECGAEHDARTDGERRVALHVRKIDFTEWSMETDGPEPPPPTDDDDTYGLGCIACGEVLVFPDDGLRDLIDPFLDRHLPCGELHVVVEMLDGTLATNGKVRRLS